MPTATLTSKGQTTILREIREHLRLRPGDRMEFIIDEDGRVLIIPISLDAAELAGILPKPRSAVSLARMKKVIRERGAGR